MHGGSQKQDGRWGNPNISEKAVPFQAPLRAVPGGTSPWPGTDTYHHGLMGTALWSTLWSRSGVTVCGTGHTMGTQCLPLMLLLVHCCVLSSLLLWNLAVDWLASAPIPVFFFFLPTPYWILILFWLCFCSITQSIGLIAAVDHLGVGNNCRSDCWELHSKYLLLVIVNSGLLSKQFNICGFLFFFPLFYIFI